ncbi:MFS transporter [Rhodovastum atsumiense]|uniref:MFS transporter n=1 Tax=Rhodovastum atsumiense TaxID=504468 RepID=A0A5M6IND2_9PROT|nr:MFS transporter [Rhodovastum atsumiense]KAA5609774.1 MFS transporter [Rhodovastum atsumiense]CAH2599446.1 MFS transporter [Rhodovastum atsumiense]
MPFRALSVHPRFRLGAVVVLGFLALALAFSARAALGLAMPVWERELGWSRGFVSGVAAVGLVVMACVAPWAGALVDRHGPRKVLVPGLAAVALGCVGVAGAERPWQFVLAYAGLASIGFGIVATHVVATAVARMTAGRRGLATGVATSGSTAGQFVLVPLIAALLAVASWRWGFLGIAMGAALLAMLALPILAVPAVARQGDRSRPPFAAELRFLAAQPTFHLLFWSFLICGFTSTGVIETHLLPYAALCGFAPMPGAVAYGVLSLVNMLGMMGAGWLTDRMNRPLLLAVIYAGRAVTFLLLLHVGDSYPALLLFAAAFGAVDYATVPVTASLVASHLGLRVMGLAMGVISAGHAAGGAAGALLGGWVFDHAAGYAWLWWGSLLAALVAAGLAAMIRMPALRAGTDAVPVD